MKHLKKALGFQTAPKQLNNPPLASRLGENVCHSFVWPLKITIENYSHAQWNANHALDPSKQVKGKRLEYGYSSSVLELSQQKVKKQQEQKLVAKGAAAATKSFQTPEQVLVIEYAIFDGINYQHVAEYYKIGGQDEYGNFGFNQHGEFVRIQKNVHTPPIVALDDPQMQNVVAFGHQEWKHEGFDAIRKNTLHQVAIFPIGKLLALVMAANKAEPTVFPLDVLQKQAAARSLRSAVPTLGSPAANTSFKQLVGHSPPDDSEQREADLTAALLQSTQKEKKKTEELEETNAHSRSLGNALENLSVATVNYSVDAVERGKREDKLVDALLLVAQNGSEGGDNKDSKKRAAVANKNVPTDAKQKSDPSDAKQKSDPKSAPATIVKLNRTAGTWVGITGAGRDLCEKERVLIRNVGGSKTAYAGHSGLALRNFTGSRPAIELDTDAEGNPIQPKLTKNLDKKFIFVQEKSP